MGKKESERRIYDDHIKEIAIDAGREGGKEGAKTTLELFGFDVDDPSESRADLDFLHKKRVRANRRSEWIDNTIIVSFVGALCLAVWNWVTRTPNGS